MPILRFRSCIGFVPKVITIEPEDVFQTGRPRRGFGGRIPRAERRWRKPGDAFSGLEGPEELHFIRA